MPYTVNTAFFDPLCKSLIDKIVEYNPASVMFAENLPRQTTDENKL